MLCREETIEGGARRDVEPQPEVRLWSISIEPFHVALGEPSTCSSRHQSERVAVGKNNESSAKGRNDAALDLVVEVCGVEQVSGPMMQLIVSAKVVEVVAEELAAL